MAEDSPLNILINKKVVSEENDKDGFGMSFEDGTVLCVYNSCDLLETSDNKSLIGRTVISVKEQKDKITMLFDTGLGLVIFMDDASYQGPEALQLITPGNPIIVWN